MARHINGEESVLIALNLWGRGDGTSTASIKLAYLYLPKRWRDLDACAKTDMAMSSLVSACRKAPGGRSGSKSKFQDGESELNEDDNPSMTRKLGVMDNTLSRLHTRNTSSALPNVRNQFPDYFLLPSLDHLKLRHPIGREPVSWPSRSQRHLRVPRPPLPPSLVPGSSPLHTTRIVTASALLTRVQVSAHIRQRVLVRHMVLRGD